ncbi:hypothetical protein PVK06_024613 [Gossypium arboreum]|uniref:Uncharacterized protein n=1 Tax=Gossypium arboreum TaxID=29729 RepID=A0ABR0PEE5_GOSAR|nr:hypothetical protein PVK06_024613 [Gossypium arboreum]
MVVDDGHEEDFYAQPEMRPYKLYHAIVLIIIVVLVNPSPILVILLPHVHLVQLLQFSRCQRNLLSTVSYTINSTFASHIT